MRKRIQNCRGKTDIIQSDIRPCPAAYLVQLAKKARCSSGTYEAILRIVCGARRCHVTMKHRKETLKDTKIASTIPIQPIPSNIRSFQLPSKLTVIHWLYWTVKKVLSCFDIAAAFKLTAVTRIDKILRNLIDYYLGKASLWKNRNAQWKVCTLQKSC